MTTGHSPDDGPKRRKDIRLDGEASVVASPDQVSRDLDDEYVILSLQGEEYFSVSSVAGRIWSLLQTPVTVNEIHDTLMAEYDVDADRCREELLELLEQLDLRRLITITRSD